MDTRLKLPSPSPATAADTEAAVALIYASDPPYYDYWFTSSQAAISRLSELWNTPGDALAAENFSLWHDQGQLIALASHYCASVQFSPTQQTAAEAAREAELAWLFPHLPTDVWYLRTLSIHPNWQGQGLGRQILSSILAKAKKQGARALHTDVDSGNAHAHHFYHRQGFALIASTTVPQLEAFRLPASYRMAIDLL